MARAARNGVAIRWRDMWPKLAEFFEIEAGPAKPTELTDFIADKDALWTTS